MARARCVIDLGRGTTLGVLSQTTADLALASDLALRWASLEVRLEAQSIVATASGRGATNLLDIGAAVLNDQDLYRLRDLVRWDFNSESLAEITRALNDYLSDYKRRGQKGVEPQREPPVFIGSLSPLSLSQHAPDLYRTLVEAVAAQRAPGTIEVESATYENPWELILAAAAIVIGGGGVFGTLPALLEIGRDWATDRRIGKASARKAEAEAELAEIYVERMREAPMRATPEELLGLMSGEQMDALARLGQQAVRWQELPETAGPQGGAP